MSEQEYPVSPQGAAVAAAAPQALPPGSAAQADQGVLPEEGADLAAPSKERSSRRGGFLKDFFSSGEVVRRLIILSVLVVFFAGAIFAFVTFNSADPLSAYRQLGRYNAQDMGSVLDFLDQNGYNYRLSGTDGIMVPVDDYNLIRERMIRSGVGISSIARDEGDSIIMTDSGFGVSQRLEGERIKHGREVQLARAIERIEGVEHATVLLAIPKENVFAREERRPSAAVVVTLRNGVYLSPETVNSIRFTVASSVHSLLSKDVTVTDQTGRLLSSQGASDSGDNRLQKEFEIRTLREAQYRDKLDSILAPMLGVGNYSAEVDVTLDTTVEEETRQMFNPDNQAVRSETLREERGTQDQTNPYGVPGSLSNQPPANAVIPQQLRDGSAEGSLSADSQQSETREAVRNYEVDTTIRHTSRPTNVVSRLTVSVAVDYLRVVDAEGVVSYVPRPQEDLDKIADLVRGGLGLDARRGDVVHVETVSFQRALEGPALPWWQHESFFRIVRVVGAVLVVLVVVIVVIRPLVNRLIRGRTDEDRALDRYDLDETSAMEGNDNFNIMAQRQDMADQIYSINRDGGIELPNLHKNEDLLKAVRTLVSNEPQLSTEVIREWINADLNENKKGKQNNNNNG